MSFRLFHIAVIATAFGNTVFRAAPLLAQSSEPSENPTIHDRAHADAALNWCAVHVARKEYVQAYSDCSYVVAREPNNAAALSNRGSIYLLSGDAAAALRDFDRGILLKPEDHSLHFNRGIALARLKDTAAAIASYSEAIRLKPNFAAAYHNRGYEFEISGQRESAIKDYKQALSLDETLKPARDGLNRLLRAL